MISVRKREMAAVLVLLAGSVAVSESVNPAAREPLPTRRPNLEIMICAHRGVKKKAPENTLPAIEMAIELGYDYVEIDVRYTKDGVPILMHDDWITRTTGGFGPPRWYNLGAIKKLDAGFWKGLEYRGTRVPTVEEALQVMEGKINLYLDQKEPPRPKLIRLMKKYGLFPDNLVIVGSGEDEKRFLEYEPRAPIMPKLHHAGQVDALLEQFPSAIAFNTSCQSLTPEMVDQAHQRGILVFTNILNVPRSFERECMKRPILYGSDVIQFDNVDLFFDLIEEMRQEAREE